MEKAARGRKRLTLQQARSDSAQLRGGEILIWTGIGLVQLRDFVRELHREEIKMVDMDRQRGSYRREKGALDFLGCKHTSTRAPGPALSATGLNLVLAWNMLFVSSCK